MWLAAIPAAIGLAQSAVGFANLSKLSKQKLPMYQETPEMMASRARANQMAQGGFTTAEQNAFDSRMAQQGNQRYRLGVTQGGGNLSSAINAGINYGNIGAQQQFAAQDAQLQRQNIKYADSFSQYVQNLANMNTSYMQQRRAQQEQAAGGAAQTGLNNIAGAGAMFQSQQNWDKLYSNPTTTTPPMNNGFAMPPSPSNNFMQNRAWGGEMFNTEG